MMSLVTVSPVITAFHSCCLSHPVFDQVNLWPAWLGLETAIFWQWSPWTVKTQRHYRLRHKITKDEDKKSAIKKRNSQIFDDIFMLYSWWYWALSICRYCKFNNIYTYMYIHSYISKIGECSWGWPEGALFHRCNTESTTPFPWLL